MRAPLSRCARAASLQKVNTDDHPHPCSSPPRSVGGAPTRTAHWRRTRPAHPLPRRNLLAHGGHRRVHRRNRRAHGPDPAQSERRGVLAGLRRGLADAAVALPGGGVVGRAAPAHPGARGRGRVDPGQFLSDRRHRRAEQAATRGRLSAEVGQRRRARGDRRDAGRHLVLHQRPATRRPSAQRARVDGARPRVGDVRVRRCTATRRIHRRRPLRRRRVVGAAEVG